MSYLNRELKPKFGQNDIKQRQKEGKFKKCKQNHKTCNISSHFPDPESAHAITLHSSLVFNKGEQKKE